MRDAQQIASIIGNDEYARSRLYPQPGGGYYLHLLDLVTALRSVVPQQAGRLLDFGCGSSPYRSLFPFPTYLRADYVPSQDIDYLIGEDQLVPAPDADFDVVLSTQVLEHVKNHGVYLAECFRLLKPGGQLILTTHGFFEEHGCPYDFRRWTADGLRYEIQSAGFEVAELKKLTTNGRAVGFLFQQHAALFMGPRRRDPLAFLYWLLFATNNTLRAAFDRWCIRRFPACAIVDPSAAGHSLYIALLAAAQKPGPR